MPAGCVTERQLSAFGKAGGVSTFLARRELPRQTIPSSADVSDAAARRLRMRLADTLLIQAVPLAATFALVWLATVGLVVINSFVPLNLVSLIYMLPVAIAATQWGLGMGIFAAVGAAAADFFFYPPLYSFWIRDPQNVVDLILFLFVAVVTSNLAARLKDETRTLRRREREIGELHAFSQGLAKCLTDRDLIFAVQDYLSNTLRYRTVLIATDRDGEVAHESRAVPEEVRRQAVEMVSAGTSRAALVEGTSRGRPWLVSVISPEILGYIAIAVELDDCGGERNGTTARRVEALLEEATLTLKHLKTKEAIEQATINYRTEILRDALVGGVSHELRTPLASILGSCSVLGEIPALAGDRQARELVEAVHEQASQLDGKIRDLLDASRINAGGVQPQLTWIDPTDVVNAALKQKERRLASHWVTVDVASDVPLVHADSTLVEQALGHLLDNAAKYSPPGSEIKVTGRCDTEGLVLSVHDRGCGLTTDEKAQVGKRSFRGRAHEAGIGGSGLGLWIASTFIAANGGSLHAESRGPGLGTIMSLRLSSISAETVLAECL